jgi:hypothetical protein
MDASKLNEAVGDRYGPALERLLARVIVSGVVLAIASVVECIQFSD